MAINTKTEKPNSSNKKHFEGIFTSGRIKGFKAGEVMIRDYFVDKAMQTKLTRTPKKIMESDAAVAHAVTKPTPGKLLMYHYDAKHKETLPYWDKFPVMFPINMYNDGWLGINMHYLPPVYRVRLLDALFETVNNEKYDKTTKFRISYEILNSAAKFKYFKPCIHRYLASHVKSQLIEIPIDEWAYTLFLPLARFQGTSQRQVWDESIKKIMAG